MPSRAGSSTTAKPSSRRVVEARGRLDELIQRAPGVGTGGGACLNFVEAQHLLAEQGALFEEVVELRVAGGDRARIAGDLRLDPAPLVLEVVTQAGPGGFGRGRAGGFVPAGVGGGHGGFSFAPARPA